MAALYALARRIDDIGDGDDEPASKVRQLDAVRRGPAHAAQPTRGPSPAIRCSPPSPTRRRGSRSRSTPSTTSSTGASRTRPAPTYKTVDELVGYCRLVAGSVGRLSLGVFGAADLATAMPLADDLGVALQLTNVLRDVAEDRAMGRVYLPATDLAEFGCAPDASGPRDAMALLVRFECARARSWYRRGLALLPHLDRRSRACTAAMAGIYRRLLDRIERHPTVVLDRRVSLPVRQKVVAAKAITWGGVKRDDASPCERASASERVANDGLRGRGTQ